MNEQALIRAHACEAADWVGELTLLLRRLPGNEPGMRAVRMITARIADRLGQALALERVAAAEPGLRVDAWSALELIEELEHEAVALAGGRLAVQLAATQIVPLTWFFDRELVSLALRNALHAALAHAHAAVALGLELREGYLGFSVSDDRGGFPPELIEETPPNPEVGELNGNALGVHFARLVARRHVAGARHGRLELRNRPDGNGTCFTLWLP